MEEMEREASTQYAQFCSVAQTIEHSAIPSTLRWGCLNVQTAEKHVLQHMLLH